MFNKMCLLYEVDRWVCEDGVGRGDDDEYEEKEQGESYRS